MLCVVMMKFNVYVVIVSVTMMFVNYVCVCVVVDRKSPLSHNN